MVFPPVGSILLEKFKEAFTTGVIERISLLREGLDNIARVQQFPECKGCVLGSLVGMKDKTVFDLPFLIGLAECGHGQLNIMFFGNVPTNDLPGKEIHDNTEVVPVTIDFDICKIAGPDKVRSFLIELLMQVIAAFAVVYMLVSVRFIRGHLGKFHRVHQAVHSSDTDLNAIITFENIGDLISSKTFVIVRVDLKNHPLNILVFLNSGSRFGIKMLIVGAAVYVQDSAQGFDSMLKSEFMNSV